MPLAFLKLFTKHGVNMKAFGNWKSLRTRFCQTLAKLRLNNWPSVCWKMEGNFLVEFFPPTPRTKVLSQAKKESLFRAFRLLNLWKNLILKNRGAVLKPCLKTFVVSFLHWDPMECPEFLRMHVGQVSQRLHRPKPPWTPYKAYTV